MRNLLLFIALAGALLAALLWLRFGGGERYPDLSTSPVLAESMLEEVLAYPEPIGNVARSPDGRLFFTVHPESRPRGNRVLEFVAGASVPYPDVGAQLALFDTVLGIAVDRQNRLWTIDHGSHGFRRARLIAFDLATNELVLDEVLPREIAPAGSTLQDLQVSADGRSVIIADTSIGRLSPGLVIYDVARGTARRVLDGHDIVSAEDFRIRSNNRDLSILGGVVALKGGVDGIAIGSDWLYFGAMNGSTLYRVAVADLLDEGLPADELANRVEPYATKPLGHGISIDTDGNLYATDVEHNSVYIIGSDRKPRTLVQSLRIRWPDGLTFGSDGWLYVTDSALPELVLKSRDHIAEQRPYRIFRVRPVAENAPGPH